MNKSPFYISISLFFAFLFIACDSSKAQEEPAVAMIELENHEADARVDVKIGGQLFTSYLYHDSSEKPVLYPILSASSTELTRGFPYNPKPFERTDHPHHIGHWLNYGDVNGLDFWNNSYRVPAERKERYGEIQHKQIVAMEPGKGKASLRVAMQWQDHEGNPLLAEETTFEFSTQDSFRIIDRTTTLTAQDQDVSFTDNKEGFVAIRVARQMEFPAEKPLKLTDANGKPADEPLLNNDGVSGSYLSSEGVEGGDVWGKRASWVRLSGVFGEKTASFVIIDHPQNVGYPTYWHARTYGLFAANPLGQKVFSKGEEELNFSLSVGESVTFRYRILVFEGNAPLTAEQIQRFVDY